ncbi:histone-lysine N-methyltransferase SETMAR [Trichonephila clavipes]|nr:histone-lysine N-methyltransferase SETMAR [Trichonephila clavipes]
MLVRCLCWILYKLEWVLMQHQPYNADTVPSECYLFSHLQLHLDGTIFHSNDKVMNEVDRFLDCAEGMEKLPKRWQTIVVLNGDYYPH